MHKVLLGIEHLMTGVQVRSPKADVLTFQMESASVVRVISDSPIEVYWPVKQTWINSEELPADSKLPDLRYSEGEAEWWAQVMAQRMRNVEANAGFPTAVVAAMRRKFGKDADTWMGNLRWDGLSKCYFFTYAGMLHGVEPDGYIHT